MSRQTKGAGFVVGPVSDDAALEGSSPEHSVVTEGFDLTKQDGVPEGRVTSERSSAKKNERKQVLLRLDPVVYAALAKWAADDLRSVNAQIEVVLRRALDDAGRGVRAGELPKRGRPKR